MASTRKIVCFVVVALSQTRPFMPIVVSKGGMFLLSFFKKLFEFDSSLLMKKSGYI